MSETGAVHASDPLLRDVQLAAVAARFNAAAKDWALRYTTQDVHGAVSRRITAQVLTWLERSGAPAGARVLDLGCGAGVLCSAVAQRGFRVIGLDIASRMLAAARRQCAASGTQASVRLALCDAAALPFPDASFHVVIAVDLLDYTQWHRWVLQDIQRILTPQGALIVSVPNTLSLARLTNPRYVTQRLAARLRQWWRLLMRRRAPPPRHRTGTSIPRYQRTYLSWDLDATAEQLGYELCARTTLGFGPLPVWQHFRRLSLWLDQVLQGLANRGWVPWLRYGGLVYLAWYQKRYEAAELRWQTPGQLIRCFEATYRPRLQARDRWMRQQRMTPVRAPQRLEHLLTADRPVLVLSPHPDDDIIGCGGTLLWLRQQGIPLIIVQLTDGSSSIGVADYDEQSRRRVRLDEAGDVARQLRAELIPWRIPDGQLRCTAETTQRLGQLLQARRPQCIFVPFLNDPHPDHWAANTILAAALSQAVPSTMSPHILSYEIWSLAPVTAYAVIDRYFAQKVQLLWRYHMGLRVHDYVAYCRWANGYHAACLEDRCGMVEAFWAVDSVTYAQHMSRAGAPDRRQRLAFPLSRERPGASGRHRTAS